MRTKLPVSNELLKPRWPDHQDVSKKGAAAKTKNAENYNKTHGPRKLTDITPGFCVRERIPGKKKWSSPTVVKNKVSETEYDVGEPSKPISNGINRVHIRTCPIINKSFARRSGRRIAAAANNSCRDGAANSGGNGAENSGGDGAVNNSGGRAANSGRDGAANSGGDRAANSDGIGSQRTAVERSSSKQWWRRSSQQW